MSNEARELHEVKQRLALVESRLEQLFEAANIAPREPSDVAEAADGDAQLQELIAAGDKTEAIKRYTELTGVGLAEAKKAVERLGG